VKEYIRNINKTSDLILSGALKNDEIERFSKSDYRWVNNKEKEFQFRKVKKGEIYQFEFGKNYAPEMSYEHRGLVIGVNKKLLYVLPIFSYDPQKHTDAYHPVQNNASKSDLYLLRSADYPFIQHDSVMKLNDIRTVSVNRILYHQKAGRIDIGTPEYKTIEELVLSKCFPEFLYEFKTCLTAKEQLENINVEQAEQITDLQNAIKEMEEKVNELNSLLSDLGKNSAD